MREQAERARLQRSEEKIKLRVPEAEGIVLGLQSRQK